MHVSVLCLQIPHRKVFNNMTECSPIFCDVLPFVGELSHLFCKILVYIDACVRTLPTDSISKGIGKKGFENMTECSPIFCDVLPFVGDCSHTFCKMLLLLFMHLCTIFES